MIGSANKDHFRFLVYCGNGYSLGEYFMPVVENLSKDCRVHLLQGDYCLTSATRRSLEALLYINENFSYQLVHVLGKGDSTFHYHRYLHRLSRSLAEHEIDMLVTSTDFYPIDRYLIHLAREKAAIVAILHSNIIAPTVLDRYRKSIGLDCEAIPISSHIGDAKRRLRRLLNQRGWVERARLVGKYSIARLNGVPRKISKAWYRFRNYYVFPYIFSRSCFYMSAYDAFGFTSGRADAVLCYDPMDAAALNHAVPEVKNIYLVHHPASVYRRPVSEKASTKKLLLLLSCYAHELPQHQMCFWNQVVKRVTDLRDVNEIHIRFHPRTDRSLRWPGRFIEMMNQLGCPVHVIDTDNISLETATDYMGAIGAVSGSLRTARAVCTGFVIGLVNASGDTSEKDWMLGEAEGIHWIHKCNELCEEHLVNFQSQDDRPTASEIFRHLLPEGKRCE